MVWEPINTAHFTRPIIISIPVWMVWEPSCKFVDGFNSFISIPVWMVWEFVALLPLTCFKLDFNSSLDGLGVIVECLTLSNFVISIPVWMVWENLNFVITIKCFQISIPVWMVWESNDLCLNALANTFQFQFGWFGSPFFISFFIYV